MSMPTSKNTKKFQIYSHVKFKEKLSFNRITALVIVFCLSLVCTGDGKLLE